MLSEHIFIHTYTPTHARAHTFIYVLVWARKPFENCIQLYNICIYFNSLVKLIFIFSNSIIANLSSHKRTPFTHLGKRTYGTCSPMNKQIIAQAINDHFWRKRYWIENKKETIWTLMRHFCLLLICFIPKSHATLFNECIYWVSFDFLAPHASTVYLFREHKMSSCFAVKTNKSLHTSSYPNTGMQFVVSELTFKKFHFIFNRNVFQRYRKH